MFVGELNLVSGDLGNTNWEVLICVYYNMAS